MAVHISVLLDECIENLNIRPDGIYVDGTLGLGGHSMEIARRLTDGGRLIAIDFKDSHCGIISVVIYYLRQQCGILAAARFKDL